MAAPYYLCGQCRKIEVLRRFLRAAEKAGDIDVIRDPDDKRQKMYGAAPGKGKGGSDWDVRFRSAKDGDRRLLPRIRDVPADVEEELVGILKRHGRPMHEDEIIAAWIKLRPKPGQTSAASGMAAIIHAQEKRTRKMARNSSIAKRQAT